MQVWPGAVHFPDFASTQAAAWWQQLLTALHASLPYDGLWLDMNEVSSYCTGDVCSGAANALCFCMPEAPETRGPL